MKSYESLPILLAFEHSEVDGSLTLVIIYVHIFSRLLSIAIMLAGKILQY